MSQTTPTNSDQSAVSTKAFVTEEGRTIDYQGDYDAYLVEHREELERFRNERSAFTPHYELDEDMWKGEGYRPTETGDESCKLDINALNIKLKAMDVNIPKGLEERQQKQKISIERAEKQISSRRRGSGQVVG